MEVHDTITLLQILITGLAAVAASSGFWLYLETSGPAYPEIHWRAIGQG